MEIQGVEKNISKATPTAFFDTGMIIGVTRSFRIEKMIGRGGFGQIYRAVDMESKLVVAVKVEQKSAESGRLILELLILVALEGCQNTPKIFYSGQIENLNFIVMQMLGKNIGEIRRQQKSRQFSPLTTSRIGVQCLQCLSQVHSLGYIHRDIKPSNICVGIGDHRRLIYLVDFGMSRKIRSNDGQFRAERVYASFRGTTRYVSMTAHERKEQGFIDDVWSLFYSLIELVEGLPWKNVTNQDEVYVAKQAFSKHFQTKRMSKNFENFLRNLENCKRTDIPEYEKLIDILKTSCGVDYNDTDGFEWENEESEDF